MSIAGEIMDRKKDRPALVRFERVPVEDKAASLKAGHYVARDVDMANITPPYSKDIFIKKAVQWLEDLKQDVSAGRMPQEWLDDYKDQYERWKRGEEMPLKGAPIKGWGVISPAQQETLIRMNILTVEDLSGINDEGMKTIGMGGMELKNKAIAWLAQLNDKGPLTMEIAELKRENALLKANHETMQKQVLELTNMVRAQQAMETLPPVLPQGIHEGDLLI